MKKDMEKTETKRPPVIVVMGHIDHGKSTLLDYIRKSNVVESEAGGITQKVSAYEVENIIEGKKEKITFLDTPGHEAFRSIRAKGAKVADIAILVVAADDGVRPQTLEALKCIEEEKIPYIVAINKIDKPEANIEKTRNNLAENEIYLEGYGGNVPSVEISAKQGKNITELLELISLVADLEDLKGNKNLPAEGVVIESYLDPQKGIAATLVIKNGSLRPGLYTVSEDTFTPIRSLENFNGEKIEEASFSSPVKIIGWNKAPRVGSLFKTFENKKEATEAVKEFVAKSLMTVKDNKESLKDSGDLKTIPVILKADTEGSLEAIKHEIEKIGGNVEFKIVNSDIGIISESDVKNALVENRPIILGFNVKVDSSAKNLAERESIVIETFDIIYKITEWLKTDLVKLLPKVEIEEITGKAKIIKVFSVQKDKQVIGGKVLEGIIQTGESFRINRRDNIVGTGKIKGLQHKKAETREVKEGLEFGSLIESKILISEGDVLEIYKIIKKSIEI